MKPSALSITPKIKNDDVTTQQAFSPFLLANRASTLIRFGTSMYFKSTALDLGDDY